MFNRLIPAALCFALLAVPAMAAPVWLVDAIIHVESKGKAHVTGRHGEIGLMQIRCATARSVGFKGKCKALYHPATNVRFGTAYLDLAIKRAGGNLRHAASLYQRGVYSKYRGCSVYCRKVMRAKRGTAHVRVDVIGR